MRRIISSKQFCTCIAWVFGLLSPSVFVSDHSVTTVAVSSGVGPGGALMAISFLLKTVDVPVEYIGKVIVTDWLLYVIFF